MPDDRFCFDCCHVKTGTWIIAIVQAVLTVIGIANAVRGAIHEYQDGADVHKQSENFYTFVATAIIWAIFLLLIFLLMMALHKNKASLVVPHFIVAIILVILSVVGIVMFIMEGGQKVLNIIYYVCFGLFLIYCLWVEYRCWQYLRGLVSVRH